MTLTYPEFLARKTAPTDTPGPTINPADIHPLLHPWQREIVAWAVKTGRAALWEDTGLGKTLQQLEWARLSAETSLVIAPLAVCQQTAREATKIGITAQYVRGGQHITGPGIWITNYEQLPHVNPDLFGELKPSYWRTAVNNLTELEAQLETPELFDMEDIS